MLNMKALKMFDLYLVLGLSGSIKIFKGSITLINDDKSIQICLMMIKVSKFVSFF